MSKVNIELNSEGVQAMLKSPEMESICRELAEDISSNYGGISEVSSQIGKTRANASVLVEGDTIEALIAMGAAKR